jgi:hypothetical protein
MKIKKLPENMETVESPIERVDRILAEFRSGAANALGQNMLPAQMIKARRISDMSSGTVRSARHERPE